MYQVINYLPNLPNKKQQSKFIKTKKKNGRLVGKLCTIQLLLKKLRGMGEDGGLTCCHGNPLSLDHCNYNIIHQFNLD